MYYIIYLIYYTLNTFSYILYGGLQRISVYSTERIYIKTYIFERVYCITFFDVPTKLNDHILQHSDLKCTYETKICSILYVKYTN